MFYNKGKSESDGIKAKEHASKSKECFLKLEDQLKKGYFDDRNKPEVCFRLSEHYKTFPDDNKEKKYLKDTLSCALQGGEEDNFEELKYVGLAQDRLLEIASLDSTVNSYEIKSDVFKQRGHFDSAIFYLQKAIQESKKNQLSSSQVFELQVEEARIFLNLIRKKRDYHLDDNATMAMAREKIDNLDEPDSNSKEEKAKLELEFQRLSIEKLFTDDVDHFDYVGDLRKSRLTLEEKVKESKVKECFIQDNLREAVFPVFHDSKVVLERCMRYIRENVFPNGKEFIYYPTKLSDLDRSNLDSYLRKIGWYHDREKSDSGIERSFSSILPALADFLVERLDNEKYPELLQFVEVRNKGEHDYKTNQIRILRQHFPETEQQIELARDACCYAVEVWKFIKIEVDDYKRQN